jgi:hypothetical protein
MVNNKPEIASEFGKIPIYGRGKTMLDNEERFRKIRTFYKWMSIIKDDKSSGAPSTPIFDPNMSGFFKTYKKPGPRVSFDSMFCGTPTKQSISEHSEKQELSELHAV